MILVHGQRRALAARGKNSRFAIELLLASNSVFATPEGDHPMSRDNDTRGVIFDGHLSEVLLKAPVSVRAVARSGSDAILNEALFALVLYDKL